MPHTRQYRLLGAIALLIILTLYYAANGAKSTQNSAFYKKTVAAIQSKNDEAARQAKLEDDRQHQRRVDQLRKEHDIAVSTSAPVLTSSETEPADKISAGAGAGAGAEQKVDSKVGQKVLGEKDAGERNVAGRVKVKGDAADGVAKVGNVEERTKPVKEERKSAETIVAETLRKAPVVIFSKSYCPFSKKAKHILLDLYTISPAPVVVELDQHEMGSEIQDALMVSTGRRTVPNVLVNGKSIGGGDDVYDLHSVGKLASTIQSMAGDKINSIVAKPQDAQAPGTGPVGGAAGMPKKEVKFKA